MEQQAKIRRDIQQLNRPKKTTKIARVLHYIGRGNRTNFQQAANELYDKHLNTTISDIRKLNIRVSDRWIKVVGFEGESVTCKEYWLTKTPDNYTNAFNYLVNAGWKSFI